MTDIPKVDRSQQMLTDGSPVPQDWSHTRDRGDGQQVGYIVLTDEERAKGWVKPYRDQYRHLTCGHTTTMGRKLSETYARDPRFYNGTFCCHCGAHFPLDQFTWLPDGGPMHPDMQEDWAATEEKRRAAAKQNEKARKRSRIVRLEREIEQLRREIDEP